MGQKNDMRAEALDTLTAIDREGRMSGGLMQDALMRNQFLPRQERAFYTRLCEGVLEKRIYLDYVLDSISKTPVRRCRPLIRNLLRMGAYQILFMNVPDAAVCNEAVALAKSRGFHRLAGFVNGVLRNLCRQKDKLPMPDEEKDPLAYLSVRYSMPEWIVSLFDSAYGKDRTLKILESFQQTRPTGIRCVTRKNDPETLRKILEEEGLTVGDGHLFPYAFTIKDYDHLARLASFREGRFTVQDESSMLPVHIAGIRQGDLVLDVCAAPGGKSMHAADCLGESGQIIARDLTSKKLDLIEDNARRLGADRIRIEQFDARDFDPSLAGKVDVLLADLPCSGLGITGRKNDIRYHLTPEKVRDLASLQKEILSVIWKYLRPGGTMIYSTCTLNPEENEENVRWITGHSPLVTESIEEDLPKSLKGRSGREGYITLIPGLDGCDGFFAAKLIRPEE